jgi:hypothetical protein
VSRGERAVHDLTRAVAVTRAQRWRRHWIADRGGRLDRGGTDLSAATPDIGCSSRVSKPPWSRAMPIS